MLKQFIRFTGISLLVAATAAVRACRDTQSEQQKLVNDAQKSLSEFLRDPKRPGCSRTSNRAKAVIIAPELPAGFIFAARCRATSSRRSGKRQCRPRVHTMAKERGLPAGISVWRTCAGDDGYGLNSPSTSVKLGGDASVRGRPVGTGARATSSRI
jgi:lipid-binding SYLF domain-containing protein